MIFLLMALKVVAGIDRDKVTVVGNTTIANGQSVALSRFPHNRGYIRYLITRSGRPNWLGSIADRFIVAGGWQRIAQTTLQTAGKKPTPTEIDEFQYRVDLGKELRIPLQ